MTILAALQSLIAQGESETLELKRSTAELKRAGDTFWAFLKDEGQGADRRRARRRARRSEGRGRHASRRRGDARPLQAGPWWREEMSRADVSNGRQVVVLEAAPSSGSQSTFLQRNDLTRFKQGARSDIRELRNDVAHNEPTPALMEDARRRMQAASLWSSTDTFLSQWLVQAVLRELGEQEPAGILDDLLANVRRRLVAPAGAAGVERHD